MMMTEHILSYKMEKNCDVRGYTSFPFGQSGLKNLGINFNVCQINQGYSYKANTLRGLHYQEAPFEQAKLIMCLKGSIYSVGVDIRKGSDTFGQYTGEVLTSENQKIMYIPRGFAHGYLTLEDDTLMQWCIDQPFRKEAASAIRYDDPDIRILWPNLSRKYVISEKDRKAALLSEL